MKVKEMARKIFRRVVLPYVMIYAAATGYAVFDYHAFNAERIRRDQDINLEVREYRTVIDGKEKHLTLVGENHLYKRADYQLAKRLVEEHTTFASEVGSGQKLPPEDESFNKIAGSLYAPFIIFYMYGSGRFYHSMDEIAEKMGHKVHALEESPYRHMSSGEKIDFAAGAGLSLLFAPAGYYVGRFGDSLNTCESYTMKESLIDRRDVEMAESIEGLLRTEGVDKLLANVGLCHLEGIIDNLSEDLYLESVSGN